MDHLSCARLQRKLGHKYISHQLVLVQTFQTGKKSNNSAKSPAPAPQGSTGEVHCEKVTCPALTCSHPVRRNPSDCCKECPEEERTAAGLEHGDMMQADGPRHCKFGKNYYQNSDNWHPWVPPMGEMKCINCWCDVSKSAAQFF